VGGVRLSWVTDEPGRSWARGMESVGAAADLGNLNEELRGAGAPGSARPNPVALEVRVNATGARPSHGTEKRELFSEDTQTAVVFPDAAVISLTAAVVPGQLVFLTNKENNQEVVCQVIRKRNNRPTSCYVELQFTEPQKDFWGVAFPEPTQQAHSESPTNLVEKVEADAVSAEATEEPAADLVTAPNTEEVNLLRHEVDALREQLKALTETKKKEEEEAAMKAAEAFRKAQEEADAAIAALAAKRDAATKPLIRMNLPAASVAAPPVTSPLKPPAAQASPSQPLPLPQAKSLATPENPGHSAEREAFEDLLPEPELDFSKAPIPSQLPEDDDRYSIYKPLRKKVGLRDAILTVAATFSLAAVIGFAWYTDRLPMARRKPPVPAATAAAPKPATPVAAPPKGSEPIAMPSAPTVLPATVPADAKAADPGGAPVGAIPSESSKSATGSEFPTEAPVGAKKTVNAAPAPPAKKRKSAIPAAPPAEAPEPMAADAPVLPAKLIRAAKPVYPPNAMRNFITGDVRIAAEVRPDGHVGKVTVISGPPALREAAVEAMKQYEYEPATKGGKPQPSQITTTIKFWFDP
jgi:periplasmic protein TonB